MQNANVKPLTNQYVLTYTFHNKISFRFYMFYYTSLRRIFAF